MAEVNWHYDKSFPSPPGNLNEWNALVERANAVAQKIIRVQVLLWDGDLELRAPYASLLEQYGIILGLLAVQDPVYIAGLCQESQTLLDNVERRLNILGQVDDTPAVATAFDALLSRHIRLADQVAELKRAAVLAVGLSQKQAQEEVLPVPLFHSATQLPLT